MNLVRLALLLCYRTRLRTRRPEQLNLEFMSNEILLRGRERFLARSMNFPSCAVCSELRGYRQVQSRCCLTGNLLIVSLLLNLACSRMVMYYACSVGWSAGHLQNKLISSKRLNCSDNITEYVTDPIAFSLIIHCVTSIMNTNHKSSL